MINVDFMHDFSALEKIQQTQRKTLNDDQYQAVEKLISTYAAQGADIVFCIKAMNKIKEEHKLEKMLQIKNDQFVKKAKMVHGDKYKYDFVNNKIICTVHGEFSQTPKNHLGGSGCPKCWKEKLKETNE